MIQITASIPPSIDDILSGQPHAILFTTLVAIAIGTIVLLIKRGKTALDPTKFIPFKLIEKKVLSHDSALFVFGLQTPETRLGLPIGQHIVLRFTDGDKRVHQRSYTPVSGNETPGTVSFVIKVYRANTHPKFPHGGMLSQHIDSLSIGDTIDMKGPKGHLEYLHKGNFNVQKSVRKPMEKRTATHFGMIAGGTGITPMLQVLHGIFRDSQDTGVTTASLLYANQTEGDILVRDELEALVKEFPTRFRLEYTVDRPAEDGSWQGSTGFVSKEMIEKHVLCGDGSSRKEMTQILMCGPPGMLKFACEPALKELGYGGDNTFTF